MLSRRQFVVLTAAALASGSALASNEAPPMLDHILLGISDLDRGIAFVEEHTGVRSSRWASGAIWKSWLPTRRRTRFLTSPKRC